VEVLQSSPSGGSFAIDPAQLIQRPDIMKNIAPNEAAAGIESGHQAA
jgi:hypothetical protein